MGLGDKKYVWQEGASQPSKDDKELEDSEIEDSCKDSRTREVKKDSSAYFGHMGHMSQHWAKC